VAKAGGDDEEGTGGVVEAPRGLGEGLAFEEVGAQGLVAALEGVGGPAEEAPRVGHEGQYHYNNNNIPVEGTRGFPAGRGACPPREVRGPHGAVLGATAAGRAGTIVAGC